MQQQLVALGRQVAAAEGRKEEAQAARQIILRELEGVRASAEAMTNFM